VLSTLKFTTTLTQLAQAMVVEASGKPWVTHSPAHLQQMADGLHGFGNARIWIYLNHALSEMSCSCAIHFETDALMWHINQQSPQMTHLLHAGDNFLSRAKQDPDVLQSWCRTVGAMCDTVMFQLNTLGKLSDHIILDDSPQRFTLRRKPDPKFSVVSPFDIIQVGDLAAAHALL
jgi:hypothetical protein